MKKINVGLIGYGVVGAGVAKLLKQRRREFQDKYGVDIVLKTIADRSIKKKNPKGFSGTHLTSKFDDVLQDDAIDVVVELIGGLNPAYDIIQNALQGEKHVVTANKAVISHYGSKLFPLARKHKKALLFESAVGAGIPIIKTITEGVAGNRFNGVYGIINGTCNFILDEMTRNDLDFDTAVKLAQDKGYAESDPTLDTNGMDAAHKLSILVSLALGKSIAVKNMYVEGIDGITHQDIEYAKEYNLTVKLLAIAKKRGNTFEARVHPTLISNDHALTSVNGVYNALFLESDPMGHILLQGEGAGQMAAASGVVSDLINLATNHEGEFPCNQPFEDKLLKLQKIEDLHLSYYLRFMVKDQSGVLSKITSILGRHNISIASVDQKIQHETSAVPLIILTHTAKESDVKRAVKEIAKLPVVKGKPVVIRTEKLS